MLTPCLCSSLFLAFLLVTKAQSFVVPVRPHHHHPSCFPLLSSSTPDDDDDAVVRYAAELLGEGDFDDYNDDDWLPDRERVLQQRKNGRRISAERVMEDDNSSSAAVAATHRPNDTEPNNREDTTKRPSPYTEEEERLITSMGGRTSSSSRDPGYLGDSTLEDISRDYGVPLCWIADVLCTWGVPVPIVPQDRLGDLVTGEQAFAMVEAVNTFDGAVLYDKYGDQTLERLCIEWDIDLGEAISMVMKEGWGLPFGVQTFLRVEHEKELLRVLGDHDRMRIEGLEDDED